MTIPIYIDGQEEGALSIESEGALTVLHARMRDIGRLVRLTVYGETEMYLGVPAPGEGGMVLRRRLTPREGRGFPRNPAYAADRRLAPEPAPEPEAEPARARHVLWQGGRPYYF